MSLNTVPKSKSFPYGWLIAIALGFSIVLLGMLALRSSFGPGIRNLANWLFALDIEQSVTWFITRSAGIVAYLMLWLSVVWGLGVASRIFDRMLHRSFTFDFHQFISLLSLGFLGLHVFILMADQYLPYSLAQVLVPFLSPYRPFWVGIGQLALYISLLVTATFYLRQKIGQKTFRLIHYTSLLGYLGATLHGIFAGTDSSLPAAILMYFGTFMVVVFLSFYWLLVLWGRKHPQIEGVQAR